MCKKLIDSLYERTDKSHLERGEFKVVGDGIIIHPSNKDIYYKIEFWGDQIDNIEIIDYVNKSNQKINELTLSPANIFVTSKNYINEAIPKILKELESQVNFLINNNQNEEAERLRDKVLYDMEMIKELGYCSGIENYSRYLDGRKENERPFCLMDYFPDDFLLVVDESHVTLPQVRAMYGGDQSRKRTLVEYGFRLPSALDNRPLSFNEFEEINNKTIYLSATPGDYEIEKSDGVIVEQLIRPTGLLEPIIEIVETKNQIDHLIDQIHNRVKKQQRVLVTTLTKKMAEKLSEFLIEAGIKTTYIHSDVDTIERIEIMKNLRLGNIDVLIGVNLLREGLDLPEVSLVAILDADKEGFLRSKRSLIQTIGRAARHIEGKSILYADIITDSMKSTMDDNERKRTIQINYNKQHNLKPKSLVKNIKTESNFKNKVKELDKVTHDIDELSVDELKKVIVKTKNKMSEAAISMEFIEAAKYRDMLKVMEAKLSKL